MNRTDLQRVQFVDDGFPDAQDYANNYIVLPQLKGRASRPRTLRATLRLLRRRVGQRIATIGLQGNRSAGTRTDPTTDCPSEAAKLLRITPDQEQKVTAGSIGDSTCGSDHPNHTVHR
jgi:hypothetical protein